MIRFLEVLKYCLFAETAIGVSILDVYIAIAIFSALVVWVIPFITAIVQFIGYKLGGK